MLLKVFFSIYHNQLTNLNIYIYIYEKINLIKIFKLHK